MFKLYQRRKRDFKKGKVKISHCPSLTRRVVKKFKKKSQVSLFEAEMSNGFSLFKIKSRMNIETNHYKTS